MVPRPENTKDLADAVTLPCGLVFPNRLIKVGDVCVTMGTVNND